MDPFDRAVNKELVQGAKVGFRIHLYVFLAVQVMLATIWWLTSNGGQVMPWFLFPLFGWGIGVVAHYLAVRASIARARRPSASEL